MEAMYGTIGKRPAWMTSDPTNDEIDAMIEAAKIMTKKARRKKARALAKKSKRGS